MQMEWNRKLNKTKIKKRLLRTFSRFRIGEHPVSEHVPDRSGNDPRDTIGIDISILQQVHDRIHARFSGTDHQILLVLLIMDVVAGVVVVGGVNAVGQFVEGDRSDDRFVDWERNAVSHPRNDNLRFAPDYFRTFDGHRPSIFDPSHRMELLLGILLLGWWHCRRFTNRTIVIRVPICLNTCCLNKLIDDLLVIRANLLPSRPIGHIVRFHHYLLLLLLLLLCLLLFVHVRSNSSSIGIVMVQFSQRDAVYTIRTRLLMQSHVWVRVNPVSARTWITIHEDESHVRQFGQQRIHKWQTCRPRTDDQIIAGCVCITCCCCCCCAILLLLIRSSSSIHVNTNGPSSSNSIVFPTYIELSWWCRQVPLVYRMVLLVVSLSIFFYLVV